MADQKMIEYHDCKLCRSYVVKSSCDFDHVKCLKGHYDNDIILCSRGGCFVPSFQCEGKDYEFNPDSDWISIYEFMFGN